MAGQLVDMLDTLDYVTFNELLVFLPNSHHWRLYLADQSLNKLFAILYFIFVHFILPPEFLYFALEQWVIEKLSSVLKLFPIEFGIFDMSYHLV